MKAAGEPSRAASAELDSSNGTGALAAEILSSLRSDLSKFDIRAYPPGTLLARERDTVHAVFLVLRGVLRQTQDRDGRDLLVGLRGVGTLVGAESVVCRASHIATVTCLSRCVIGGISASSFMGLLDTNVDVCRATITALAVQVAGALRERQHLDRCQADERVEWILREMMEEGAVRRSDGSSVLPFRLTITDIASMVGITRETASRLVSQLAKRGLLARESGRLVAPSGSPLARR